MRIIKLANETYQGGWTGPFYHGSPNEFDEFDLNNTNIDHTPIGDEGLIYLTGDKDYASNYGEVQEFMVNLGKYDIMHIKDVSKLKNGELDSILVAPNWNPFRQEHPSKDQIEEVVVKDPSRVKKG